MKITVLASGSKGNATYIETAQTKLLIDAGISFRQLKLKLLQNGISLTTLDAILISHEHTDHTKGLVNTIKNTKATLYTTEKTYHHLLNKTTYDLKDALFSPIIADQTIIINDLTIEALRVSHDAVDTLGFILYNGTKKLVHMTDIGYLPVEDYPKIENAETYVFESNYDVSLLFSSNRPYYLKRRIDSIKGHLSNADSAYHLSQIIGEKTKRIILAHPSEECNTEYHALETLKDVFMSYDIDINQYDIVVAKQHQPTKVYKL